MIGKEKMDSQKPMKVVILAGGLGTRLAEYTSDIPKPMVQIGGKPILWHIMNFYASYGFDDFYIALGYKGECIKEYFLNYATLNSDFTVDLATGSVQCLRQSKLSWKVTLVETGQNSMTGGRLKRMQPHLKDTFLLTYGDGLSNVNLKQLVRFHENQKRVVTVTAVRPTARFGELQIIDGQVTNFLEKPQTNVGWINGGFFVMEPSFLDSIEGDDTILEREPLENASKQGQLSAYQHDGFWQCMDTVRDLKSLEILWQEGKAPWKV